MIELTSASLKPCQPDKHALMSGSSLEADLLSCSPPLISAAALQGGRIEVGAPTGKWQLIVIYRGKHCPVSRSAPQMHSASPRHACNSGLQPWADFHPGPFTLQQHAHARGGKKAGLTSPFERPLFHSDSPVFHSDATMGRPRLSWESRP